MMLVLGSLVGVSLIELLLYVTPLWHVRRAIAGGLLVMLAGLSGLLMAESFNIATCLVLLISLYRVFNLLRIVEARMNESYLRRVTLKSSLILIGFQLVVGAVLGLMTFFAIDATAGWLVLICLQLGVAMVIAFNTWRHLKQSIQPGVEKHFSDQDLPSISVCIPARNETESLESCLRSLVASDYPKLEILVLDDQSHDRTPDIIRSFAQDGVRFVKGTVPAEGWLAKNWAYQQLYQASSGDMLVFCGVDVRFEPSALRELITTMLVEKRQMIAVVPLNQPPRGVGQQRAFLLQPLRYAWEFCLPRQFYKRPPVLSTCWAVARQLLVKTGDFSAVMASVTPESHFARITASDNSYSFVRANTSLAISSLKTLRDQWDTAVRTRYPQLHKRPELVCLMSLTEVLAAVLPIIVGIVAAFHGHWFLAVLAMVGAAIIAVAYAAVIWSTYRRFYWRSLLALPFAALLDVYIRHESMWRYEFNAVTWKERNVTFPVMHVIPRLPQLPKS